MRTYVWAAAILTSTAIICPAHAAITVYTTLAGFNAATIGRGVDTFNNLSVIRYPSPLKRTAGSLAYSATVLRDVDSTDSQDFYGAGENDRWLSTNVAGDIVSFGGWSSSVSAIGGLFFGTNKNGSFTAHPGGVTVTATDAGGTVTRVVLNPTTSSFLGFVSTGGLSQLTVRTNLTATSVWPTINNLTLARAAAVTAVPEPASWAMMILGLGAVGVAMRRRGKVSTTVGFA